MLRASQIVLQKFICKFEVSFPPIHPDWTAFISTLPMQMMVGTITATELTMYSHNRRIDTFLVRTLPLLFLALHVAGTRFGTACGTASSGS